MPKKFTYEYHVTGKKLEGKNLPVNYVYGFAYKKLLYKGHTKFQSIELYDTPLFGKLLKLDGNFQTSEKDEFFYHEPSVHVPLCSHPNPKRVLIIGAGDGGILKNVLMHKTVEKAVIVEIDKEVVEFSMKYLKSICGQAFQDKRTHLVIGDGKRYVEETNEKFDVIIMDLTDPIGPAKALYTREFYHKLKERLAKNGILQLHIELCITRGALSAELYKNLASCFKYAALFTSYVPLYGTLMAFSANSDDIDCRKINPALVEKRLRERGVAGLKFYNGAVHQALFALPNYLKELFSA